MDTEYYHDYEDPKMVAEKEDKFELKHCAVRDTRQAMFDAYKDSGYDWCMIKDAFVHHDGYWISTRDAMKAWLNGTTNIGKC